MNTSRIFLLIVFLILNLSGTSQKKTLYFDILRNGNKVGMIVFSQSASGGVDSLRSESTVKTKLVRTVVAEAKETAVFKDGILKESFIYRKLNGKEKANKKHRAVNGKYVITIGTQLSELDAYPITYNMLCLYSKEPVNIRKVYSDNHESSLKIEKIEDHKYKVILPDDNYNYYLYKDGVLNQVEIHRSLYSAKVVLVTKRT